MAILVILRIQRQHCTAWIPVFHANGGSYDWISHVPSLCGKQRLFWLDKKVHPSFKRTYPCHDAGNRGFVLLDNDVIDKQCEVCGIWILYRAMFNRFPIPISAGKNFSLCFSY